MTDIALANDFDLHRTNVTSRGVVQTGLTVRGFLSLTKDGAAIHPTLEVVLTEIAPGDYIGTIQGYNISTQLGPLLDAAPAGKLKVYDRVVVDTEDYGDYFELTVRRGRQAGT